MSDLTEEQRAMLVGTEARMQGYYIGFERTGNDLVDQILSAIAYAAKGAHSTSSWGEASEYGYGPVPPGESFEWLIQEAANDAAERLSAGVVAAEPEWEYGIRDNSTCTRVVMWGSNRERIESQMYRWAGSTLVKRIIAGEWVPVKQEGAETDA